MSATDTLVGPQQLRGRVTVQLVLQRFALVGPQVRSVAAAPFVEEGGKALLLVGACPTEEAVTTTPAEVEYLGQTVAQAVETQRLVAGFGVSILTRQLCCREGIRLTLAEVKDPLAHTSGYHV